MLVRMVASCVVNDVETSSWFGQEEAVNKKKGIYILVYGNPG